MCYVPHPAILMHKIFGAGINYYLHMWVYIASINVQLKKSDALALFMSLYSLVVHSSFFIFFGNFNRLSVIEERSSLSSPISFFEECFGVADLGTVLTEFDIEERDDV
jgi:hypothetical protein